jgi:hypothetical protein
VVGVAQQLGADALTQARALIGAANAALAPLSPVFRIIDAVLAVKAFAEAVPELIVNPGAVVEAVIELVAKIGRLAALVPQLSLPLTILGLVDAVITLLEGVLAELTVIEQQAARVEATRTSAAGLPADAQVALLAIADAATAQLEVRRADLATALGTVRPVIALLNTLGGLAGLPALEVEEGGSTEALNAAVTALRTFRNAIPV